MKENIKKKHIKKNSKPKYSELFIKKIMEANGLDKKTALLLLEKLQIKEF